MSWSTKWTLNCFLRILWHVWMEISVSISLFLIICCPFFDSLMYSLHISFCVFGFLSSLEIKEKLLLNFMIIKTGLSNYCFCFAGVLLVTSISLYFFVFSAPSPCLPINCSFILWKGNSKGEKFVLFEPILECSNGRPLPSTLMAGIFFWCSTNIPKPLKIHRHCVRMVFYIF